MHGDFIRRSQGLLVVDGVYGSTYNANTVDVIDSNLEGLRHRPDHPDIDRLLDARLIVGALRASTLAGGTSSGMCGTV